MDHEKFWKLTWYEWNLYLKGYIHHKEERGAEIRTIMAHIANCTAPRQDRQPWRAKDFEPLPVNVSERKLTMKEAKQMLGSKWRTPDGK
jgi:hypothetical protein